jgi:hypothetical protein
MGRRSERLIPGGVQGRVNAQARRHLVSGIFLQTMTVCPVFESIRVVTGSQRQETVFEFSCLLTTQCSITCALAGGIWLRIGAGARTGAGAGGGGGVAATGFFLAPHPVRTRIPARKKMEQNCLITMNGRLLAQYNPVGLTEPIAIEDAGLRESHDWCEYGTRTMVNGQAGAQIA